MAQIRRLATILVRDRTSPWPRARSLTALRGRDRSPVLRGGEDDSSRVSQPRRQADAYVPFYGTASGIHHMDASGMRGQMSGDVFDVEAAPSDRYVCEALTMSHNLTWRVLYDFNEEPRLGIDAELKAARKGVR